MVLSSVYHVELLLGLIIQIILSSHDQVHECIIICIFPGFNVK